MIDRKTARTEIEEPGSVLAGEGYSILLVEDDGALRSLILQLLRRSGFRANGVRNGIEMREAIEKSQIDLVLLDVMLPGASGFDLCKELRAQSSVPVIMLTALGEAADRVIGLELGADDYIVKPPEPRELIARIRALIRRRERFSGKSVETVRDKAYFLGWTLNTRNRELISPEGYRVELTGGEYDLLLAFIERPQRVLSREQLLDVARGRSYGGLERSIDAQISRLRSKVDACGERRGEIIKTLRGAGYIMTADVSWQ